MPPIDACASWRLAEAEALPGFCLRVRFNDGIAGFIDMAAFLKSNMAGVFVTLRDELFFRRVTVSLGAVSWPGGLDLAPDAMHAAIKEHGIWVLE
jgi:hypothetical protein